MFLLEVEIFKVFILAFIRFSGLIVAAPILGSSNIPARVKVGLAVMSAIIVTLFTLGWDPSEPRKWHADTGQCHTCDEATLAAGTADWGPLKEAIAEPIQRRLW